MKLTVKCYRNQDKVVCNNLRSEKVKPLQMLPFNTPQNFQKILRFSEKLQGVLDGNIEKKKGLNQCNPVCRSSRPKVFCKKDIKISQNSQESTCFRVSFLIKFQDEACHFIQKETLVQVFSREFCKIFKHTFFIEQSEAASTFNSFFDHHDKFH